MGSDGSSVPAGEGETSLSSGFDILVIGTSDGITKVVSRDDWENDKMGFQPQKGIKPVFLRKQSSPNFPRKDGLCPLGCKANVINQSPSQQFVAPNPLTLTLIKTGSHAQKSLLGTCLGTCKRYPYAPNQE